MIHYLLKIMSNKTIYRFMFLFTLLLAISIDGNGQNLKELLSNLQSNQNTEEKIITLKSIAIHYQK